MEKELTSKEISYNEKYKNLLVETKPIIDSLTNNESDIFLVNRGYGKTKEGRTKEFMTIKIYFDKGKDENN